MVAPCPVEPILALALGPPVNTSVGTSPGLGEGVINGCQPVNKLY